MKDIKNVDLKELKDVIKELNESGLVEKKLKTVGIKATVMLESFVAAVDAALELDPDTDFPQSVADFYSVVMENGDDDDSSDNDEIESDEDEDVESDEDEDVDESTPTTKEWNTVKDQRVKHLSEDDDDADIEEASEENEEGDTDEDVEDDTSDEDDEDIPAPVKKKKKTEPKTKKPVVVKEKPVKEKKSLVVKDKAEPKKKSLAVEKRATINPKLSLTKKVTNLLDFKDMRYKQTAYFPLDCETVRVLETNAGLYPAEILAAIKADKKAAKKVEKFSEGIMSREINKIKSAYSYIVGAIREDKIESKFRNIMLHLLAGKDVPPDVAHYSTVKVARRALLAYLDVTGVDYSVMKDTRKELVKKAAEKKEAPAPKAEPKPAEKKAPEPKPAEKKEAPAKKAKPVATKKSSKK